MTTPRNTDIKETYDHVLAGLPIVPGQAINQGDMVMWDTSLNSGNGGVRSLNIQNDASNYLGVAMQTSPFASLGDVFATIEIRRGGIVRLHTTSAEVYKFFTKLYFNEAADAQTVTNVPTGRTYGVAMAILPQQLAMSGVTSLTGAAGVDLQAWLTPVYPFATI